MAEETYSPETQEKIFQAMENILSFIHSLQLEVQVATPAVMMISAQLTAAGVLNGDEYIINQYKLCLQQARENPLIAVGDPYDA